METKEPTAHDYKLKKWSEIIEAKHNSGMKVNEFCESTGVSRNSYYYWQRRLRDNALKSLIKTEDTCSSPNAWIELNPLKDFDSTLEIEANGLKISVSHDTDMDLLKKVCCMLRGL